jgi:AcrR family transcriptional regulator
MASQKRAQLIDTAERLFYANGFHATGIDRIVQAAGVVRMTLYNHFPSKDDLVQAVLDARHARFMDKVDRAVAQAADGQATRALVEAHGQWLAETSRRGCIMARAMGEFAESSPRLHDRAAQAKRDLLDKIADALARDGVEDAGLARRVYLVLEGSNAAVPVLGAETALAETRCAVDDLLEYTEGGGA